jgi:hypothetical protein
MRAPFARLPDPVTTPQPPDATMFQDVSGLEVSTGWLAKVMPHASGLRPGFRTNLPRLPLQRRGRLTVRRAWSCLRSLTATDAGAYKITDLLEDLY